MAIANKTRKSYPTRSYLATGGLSPKHLKFCEGVATGQTVAEAFFNAGFKLTPFVNPEKVYQSPNVRAQIDRLRRIAEVKTAMTREELAAFLAAVIRTPIGDLDPTSILCAEFSVDTIRDKKTDEEIVKRTRVKGIPKLDAAKQLIQMQGWAEPSQLVVDSGPNMLAQLEERAKHLVSSLNRAGCVDV